MKRFFAIIVIIFGVIVLSSAPSQAANLSNHNVLSVLPQSILLAQAPSNCGEAQEIQFKPGTTSDTVVGYNRQYYLSASGGQQMSAGVIPIPAPDSPVTLTVFGADGTVLSNGNMSGASTFTGELPSTQDYCLSVGKKPAQEVQLFVSIID